MFENADFSGLRANEISEYPLEWLHEPPDNPDCVVLLLKYMGESNKPFMNARAKMPRKTGEALEEHLASIFGRTVIVGWRNVLDRTTKAPVAFTASFGESLVAAMRAQENGKEALGEIIAYARTRENFRAPVVDAGDLGNV